ncbi:proteasome alpha subunit D2, partial [Striga asiatica]
IGLYLQSTIYLAFVFQNSGPQDSIKPAMHSVIIVGNNDYLILRRNPGAEESDAWSVYSATCSGETAGSSNKNRLKLAEEWLRAAVSTVVSLLIKLLPEYNPSDPGFLCESSILCLISCTDQK